MKDVKFKPGDVVQLRSGGPLMTVQGLLNGKLACVWFPDEKCEVPSQASFDETVLRMLSESELFIVHEKQLAK